MREKKASTYFVLVVLFFLPVAFLLLLYPATHNYTPLEVIKKDVLDLNDFKAVNNEQILLKDHITVLGFLGNEPVKHSIAASNLKELVYDKFKGFKKFQVVMLLPFGTEASVDTLKKEISSYESLDYWHFVFASPGHIKQVYNSLKTNLPLANDLFTQKVFVVDKDLSQRGRFDDREDKEKEKNKPVYGLNGYDCIEVAEIKNKMSDDLRVLFTEYRQKRKGEFENTDTRRANDLKSDHEEN
ncbi:hypothetical protein PW52_10510 [Tamlana sedimentorum]|uniref:Membrane or secreted protein n=1 Tax=Neotamlana sedimentorum TaxID=1435349 RepID=A0A0D7WA43_9FLAO|nr:hypothetical protein [Tamlana sedimentorum]KJD35513.1 hypothetical protein PW52_10510 [Tamlana sedimentorum]